MPRWEPDARGRLWDAALTLFEERGYESTTVADITDRAGLTRRTFFRHFPDKRDVLFDGSSELERLVVTELGEVPADTGPLRAAVTALHAGAAWFEDVRDVAIRRQRVIEANRGLLERELLKLVSLATAIGAGLRARGVEATTATLAAEASVTVFRVAFGRWAREDDGRPLTDTLSAVHDELRAIAEPGRAA